MPRESRAIAALKSEVISTPSSMVASAARLPMPEAKARRAKAMKDNEWEVEGWDCYDTIGEYRYSVSQVGNMLSKARITILKNGEPTTDQEALDALASLFGGEDGQTEMLRQLGIHFSVAGEAYLFAVPDEDGGMDEWIVAAAVEVKVTGSAENPRIKLENELLQDPLAIRLWRPHPRKRFAADSPTRALLPILREIAQLTKHVAAQVDSRLAGAGVLLVPSEMTSATGTTDADGNATPSPTAASLLNTLMEAMAASLSSHDDAASLVPIVLQAPGETLDKVRHVTFWSPLEAQTIELRKEAIRRLALGMDMPPEALLGTEGMNHWGAWQMEEAAIKAHTEPLLTVIVQALTAGYLHPLLKASGIEDPTIYSFGTDTSKMRLRPNRSKEALELYNLGQVSGETLRRENGFDPEDAMRNEETREWLTRKVASGSTTPELVAAALAALGVKLIEAVSPDKTQEARPDPTLREHPVHELPKDKSDDSVLAASEVMVFRALERAGNRLRSKLQTKIPNVSAADTYLYVAMDAKTVDFVLQDSWGLVDRLSASLGVDPVRLSDCLDSYVRTLLIEHKPHSREMLASYIDLAQKPAA